MTRLRVKRILAAALLFCAAPALQAQVVVSGGVFGGGRMANVNGNSDILVQGQSGQTTTLNGVYGGNDIAGSVSGSTGSTIVVGATADNAASASTANSNAIVITELYGGGNGYYQYPGLAAASTGLSSSQTSTSTSGDVMSFDGTETVIAVSGTTTVPAIAKTSISVLGSGVVVTDLFGGAKNAFVTNASGNSATITIADGTITNAFGGNNYGGNLAGDISISVSGTTQPASLANASYATVGSDWGIKYLYGGGNKVAVPGSAAISVTGGLIETCFAGGNSATVATTASVTLNTTAAATYTAGGTAYDGASGFYNIRTLYGGNNLADMSGMPTLTLTKGGVGTVYGGGKLGGMLAANTAKVSGRTLGTYVSATSNNFKADVIYGGCQQADVSNGGTYVAVSGGEIGNIYGGCNISGTVSDASSAGGANVAISGGIVRHNVYGGSNGYYGFREASTFQYANNIYNSAADYTGTLFPLVNTTRVAISGGTVEGNVYAGGELAPVGVDRSLPGVSFSPNTGSVSLSIAEGGVLVKGNVFGGGRMAPVYGMSRLALDAANAYNGTDEAPSTQGVKVLGDIYGGNDIAGSITTASAISASNSTSYTVATAVSLTGAVQIDGSVFGGGNGEYTYYTTTAAYNAASESNKVLVESTDDKPIVDGGALVDVHTSNLSRISKVYGGGNSATVNTRATVLLNAASVPASTTDNNVDTLFGGNNNVAMSIMPDIDLVKGYVGTVYGGGNKGAITCVSGSVTNASDQAVTGLSTYVLLHNATDLAVTGTIYGGCRVANVAAKTYVDLYSGTANDVFGGNDVGGTVGSAYVDLSGTARVANIYGGGNGKYYYTGAEGNRTAYLFSNHSRAVASGVQSYANTNNTHVLLNSGSVTGDVYGGGLAGDAGYTNVTVESGASVGGTMYGGGCGNVEYIGTSPVDHPHVGNVTQTARLTINGLGAELKRAFGGGRAGDVLNTAVVVKDAVNQRIKALYGGCMASDLTGTSSVTVGQTPLYMGATACGTIVIDTLYGGNDFAGLTQNTDIVINQGTFTTVFGAGNGEYDYQGLIDAGKIATAGTNGYDTVPYSMDINIVYNGGYFTDRVFGGGNMGLVGDKSISYSNYPEGDHNSSLYGHINVDIHNGYFDQHVFAGAKGSLSSAKRHFGFTDPAASPASPAPDGLQNTASSNPRNSLDVKMLAYAYKQVNMDGGYMRYSLYGGSEAVDDGYPYECWDTPEENTSMRPSTVINIVGGTIMNRLYGGGYRGNAYGSIYINVGERAIVQCPVWSKTYQRSGSAYSASFADYQLKATSLTKSTIYLMASIYNGSDWGEAGQNEYFDTRGFFGGIGLIYIDGEGYDSYTELHSLNPEMLITNSIIGAGTSTRQADVSSRIIIKNYGDYSCPTPSRSIKSVQRTDRLYVDNVYLSLTGEQDAFQSYTSSNRSFCRIDSLVMHHRNILECSAPSEYVGLLRSEDDNSVLYSNASLYNKCVSCTDEGALSICDLITTDVINSNTLLLDDGTYFQIFPYKDSDNDHVEDNADPDSPDHDYGEVQGWTYLMAPNGTRANVMARPKTTSTSSSVAAQLAACGLTPAGPLSSDAIYTADGGFVCPCSGSNTGHNASESTTGAIVNEVAYGNVTNSGSTYRSWTVGTNEGERARHITLVAHADPTKVTEDQEIKNSDNTSTGYAYAKASLVLPPSNGGNYYTISSVSVDDDNGGQVELVDFAYNPTTNKWFSTFDVGSTDTAASRAASQTAISDDPNYTFGLQFTLGNNFNTTSAGSTITINGTNYTTQNSSVVSGNSNLSSLGGFYSVPIVSGTALLPTLDFVLVYNTNFNTTITRDVVFRMEEYTSAGTYVGPVDVTVTISTVLTNFNNLEAPLLAMFNEGVSNEYKRKVIVPASFLQRNLYLDSIRYAPTSDNDPYGWESTKSVYQAATTDTASETRFRLLQQGATITDYKQFTVTITPTQDVTDNISNSLGWYDIQTSAQNMDLRELATETNSGNYSDERRYGFHDFTNNGAQLGKHIGVLDGRAAASFDVTLTFNGSFMYDDVLDLAHFKLYFHYVNTQDNTTGGQFSIDIKLRTRQFGDTIYMAEPANMYAYTSNSSQVIDTLLPSGVTAAYTLSRYDGTDLKSYTTSCGYKKNDPKQYLSTFQRAMDVYDEGDVICILNPIHINNSQMPVSLQGADFSTINIIRYTGSHYHWPGDVCTYRGPLIVVSDGAKFTLSNVRIDGGGCHRTALGEAESGTDGYNDDGEDDTRYVRWNGTKYQYYKTQRDTNFVHAPVFWVEDGSSLYLRSNVKVLHNFNVFNWDGSSYASTKPVTTTTSTTTDGVTTNSTSITYPKSPALPGGAIGAHRTCTSTACAVPSITLGNSVTIEDNIVTDQGTPHAPGNYGAGIFSDGARVKLGNGRTDNVVTVCNNYYFPPITSSNCTTYFSPADITGITYNKVVVGQNSTTSTTTCTTSVALYKLNTIPAGTVPSNIRLTRTRATSAPGIGTSSAAAKTVNDYEVLYDSQTDLISVSQQLDATSRIGISKWFPGYIPNDTYGRDTIGIVDYSVAGSLAASENYASGIFSDDSAHVTTSTPNYYRRPENDNVDIRYSSLLNNNKIYLHRCGTFSEQDIAVKFAANPAVICPGDGDTLKYFVQGGSANYTYSWRAYNDETTTDTTTYSLGNIVSTSNEGFLVMSDFSMSPSDHYRIYRARVTATEAGGCQLSHEIKVLLKRVNIGLTTELEAANESVEHDYSAGQYDMTRDLFYSRAVDDFMGFADWGIWNQHIRHQYPAPGTETNGPSGTDTAKAVRLYKAYKLNWAVSPAEANATCNAYSLYGSTTGNAGVVDYANPLTSGVSDICPGDSVHMEVTYNTDNWEFSMWNKDANAGATANFVVTRDNQSLIAYLTPKTYWWETVTTNPGTGHFEQDYNGKIHIYDKQGLAWLISTTNGLNGQQARSYAFDTIIIHRKTFDPNSSTYSDDYNTYNMGAHKWTPLGTSRTPFRGTIIMEGPERDAQGNVTNANVAHIRKIMVSEPYATYGGMFGYVDSARIDSLRTHACMYKAMTYVGGVAGFAGPNTIVTNCDVDSNSITSGNSGGGIFGSAEDVTVNNCVANPTMQGNMLYAGGLAGRMKGSSASNCTTSVSSSLLSTLYQGGLAGYAVNSDQSTGASGAKDAHDGHVNLTNNCVHIVSGDNSFYVGGLVGNATGVDMVNNYAYGSLEGASANGGLVGHVGSDVSAQNCYFASTDAAAASGSGRSMAQHNTSTFAGQGNHVTLADSVYGTNNLTIALNQWVRQANGAKSAEVEYNTWRSDLDNQHDGYPVFGTPDLIPVYTTVADEACDSYTWHDSVYTVSGSYQHSEPDPANFVDSITVMNLTIHYSQQMDITDSVRLGDDYFGETYSFSADQIRQMLGDDSLADVHTLQIVDSLLTQYGCDSVVTFNLVVYGTTGINPAARFDVSVYPNPTTGRVEVRADALQHAELYDAVSRKLMEQQGTDGACRFDISNLPAGTYYVRIRSAQGTAVQKLIKR